MLMDAENLQRLINITAERQRQADHVMRARMVGDEETAQFYERPPEQRQRLLAEQDIRDVVEAVNSGDAAGTEHYVRNAVNRQLYGGARLRPRRRLPG